MTVPTEKPVAYAAIAGLGLIAGLSMQRPELIVAAAPFVLWLTAGLVLAGSPRFGARVVAERERILVGERLGLNLTLKTSAPLERVDVELPALGETDRSGVIAVDMVGLARRTVTLSRSAHRIGVYQLEPRRLSARDRFGLFQFLPDAVHAGELRAFPKLPAVRSALLAADTQVFSGSQVSRHRGEGIEFAELRPLAAGETGARIHWPSLARRGSPYVAERLAERNTDLVLFLDAFEPLRGEGGTGTLEMAIAAAATLAQHHLARRDRVGLVSFGGTLGWLEARMGAAQLSRIIDALLETRVVLSYAWKSIDIIPPRVIPPRASVVALTPLLDPRVANALIDLRARGFDLAVIEISPLGFLPAPVGDLQRLARRFWLLQRAEQRRRYREMGIPVTTLSDPGSLEQSISEVNRFKRSRQHVFA